MQYVWAAGTPCAQKRVHIQKFDMAGNAEFAALCGQDLPFDRSINAPFSLGRKICKHCLAVLNGERKIAA